MNKIRVLVVDDSKTMQHLLTHLFSNESDMEVIGVARNGEQAVTLAKQLKPDVITMDMKMPVMNGCEATKKIMAEHPTPIVMISSSFSRRETELTFEALEAGALHVISKPDMTNSEKKFEHQCQSLVENVRLMSGIKVIRRHREFLTSRLELEKKHDQSTSSIELIVMGSSVGGPLALKTILSALPQNFSVPIAVVQHISLGFMEGFVKWLQQYMPLPLICATNHLAIKPGHVYLAPDHYHLGIQKSNGELYTTLSDDPEINGFKPSISYLFSTAYQACQHKLMAGILTGMGEDGAAELLKIKQGRGHTFIQDQETSVVFGIAGKALKLGATKTVLPVTEIAAYLVQMAQSGKHDVTQQM